ncbi:MAG TPA: Calx-beta domain-containing protein, partial [Actinomycetota bacterium]|nr:Calx-beta domain-containing protein [Actinomycetota bacterium]
LSRDEHDFDPAWHPLGGLMWATNGQLVFDSDPADNVTATLTLTGTDRRISKPDVSPSGDRVAYVARLVGDTQTDVYVFDVNQPDAADEKVTFTPFDDFAPSWSPDDRKLAVASKDQASDQDLEIFVVDTQPPEGGTATRRRLTFNNTDENEPDWGTPQVTASVQQRLTLPEGNPAAGQTTSTSTFAFAVFLSAPVPNGQQVTVRVATLAGSATTGNDYNAVDQTITFDPGEQTKTFSVPVVADTVAETNESFSIRIQQVTNALVGNAEGRALITNDDVPPTPTPTPTPTATPSPTPVPGVPGGQIAYTSGVDGDYDVWIMDGDGAGKTNLTSDPSSEGSPDLSPDGTAVAFQRMIGSPSGGQPPDFQIYRVPSAGGSATFLNGSPDAFDVTPAWSPDGTGLAWVSSTSAGDPDVYTASPPNGTPAIVLDTPDLEGYSEWGRLANGTEAIAYHVQPDDPAGQWVVRLVELPSKTVRSFGEGRHPEISPDGRRLVFASNRTGGDYEIYVLDLTAAGASPTALTSNSDDDFNPSWSPDGTKIAWTSHPGGGRPDVFTMNAKGSGQQNLTNSPSTDDFEPSWGVKPSPPSSRKTAPAAILVMLPVVGIASALAGRKRR